jgi:hypothetical protein
LSNIYGQQESELYLKYRDNFKFIKGYIIRNDSDKIDGLLKDPIDDEASKYSSVVFIPKTGKKMTLYPKDILEYGYLSYTFVSYDNSFYELVQNGPKLKLYKKSKKVLNTSSYGPQGQGSVSSIDREIFYLKKANEEEFIEFRKRDFDEKASEYFGDCKNLYSKIVSKELTFKDLPEIVRKFNWCKS